MTNKEIYKIWAPYGKKWVDWVRPVPFVAIKNVKKFNPTVRRVECLPQEKENIKHIAIIADLPDEQSVELGIWLAENYGYRPIPIFNGTIEQDGARATTNNADMLDALVWGAHQLEKIEIPVDAPPVFLIDKNRLQNIKLDRTVFDNSWDIYHQDIPSEKYFIANGITEILVISKNLSKDFKLIFKEFSEQQIPIYLSDGYSKPKCVRKPKRKKI
jgi:hypothetical protein